MYIGMVFTTQIYKLWIMSPDIIFILSLVLLAIWFPIELSRLNFGYKGNIGETVR
jgi:hypothetical protein